MSGIGTDDVEFERRRRYTRGTRRVPCRYRGTCLPQEDSDGRAAFRGARIINLSFVFGRHALPARSSLRRNVDFRVGVNFCRAITDLSRLGENPPCSRFVSLRRIIQVGVRD